VVIPLLPAVTVLLPEATALLLRNKRRNKVMVRHPVFNRRLRPA
jgi:hypothetical protein